MPDTTAPRQMRCDFCSKSGPSKAFSCNFTDRSPGSAWATRCRCSRTAEQHAADPGLDHPYEPQGPRDTDTFYCGCFGWD